MEVEAAPPVETPVFGIAIHTIEGALCTGRTPSSTPCPWRARAARATVRFDVARLHLHEGRFTVTLAVHSHDHATVYHWLDRWVEFSVFPRATGRRRRRRVGAVEPDGEGDGCPQDCAE